MKKITNYTQRIIRNLFPFYTVNKKSRAFLKRFKKYSFFGTKCNDEKQYEAVITRYLHTIEKGLSYPEYRAGFGKYNIDALLTSMENYVNSGYNKNAFFYCTALSALATYVSKNKEYGVEDPQLESRISALGGIGNQLGGIIVFSPLSSEEVKKLGYADFVKNRHSLRHFSEKPVDIELVKNAVCLAQHTPSACNRQGWRTVIISDKAAIKTVCANQNGNEGFGHKFDKMLLITADLRCFNRDRELYQAFIDGGMYAESILNALHYYHIASCPLSASLHEYQEDNIRKLLNLNEAEIFIMLVGIGSYPDICQTARSERRPSEMEVHT